MNSDLRVPEQGVLTLIILMMATYLFVDFSYGAFVLAGFAELKVSLVFKALLLSLVVMYLAVAKPRYALICIGLVACFLVPILFALLRGADVSGFVYDLTFATKFLAPILVFLFWCSIADKPDRLNSSRLVLWVLTGAVVFNSILGALGIGFHSYGSPEVGFGNPGLIFAANEYGALLIVIVGFVLNESWLRGAITFGSVAIISVLVTLMVATKTALLGVVLLVALVPLFNERTLLFRPTVMKLKVLTLVLVSCSFIALLLSQFFQDLGLFNRALFFYEAGGLSRLIFSGRDEMAGAMVTAYIDASDLLHWIFGAPPSFFVSQGVKPSAEIDPFDLLMWFGPLSFFTLCVWIVIVFGFSWRALVSASCREAPAVISVNIALLAAASIAGHVWTSGVVGVAWATLNATVVWPSGEHSGKSTDRRGLTKASA